MPRDISRASICSGNRSCASGRVEDARKALQFAEKYRRSKIRYDTQAIFDEKVLAGSRDSRASRTYRGLARGGGPRTPGREDQPRTIRARRRAALPMYRSARTRFRRPTKQYRASPQKILRQLYNDIGVMRRKASETLHEAANLKASPKSGIMALPGIDAQLGLRPTVPENGFEPSLPASATSQPTSTKPLVRQILALSYLDKEKYASRRKVLHSCENIPPTIRTPSHGNRT